MRNLNELTSDDLAALQPGEQLSAPSERHPRFESLYPTHAVTGRLNGEIVTTLLTMSFPPAPQMFKVITVDEGGNPTLETAGSAPRPPVQVELAQIRADSETTAKIAALMMKQAWDLDQEHVLSALAVYLPELKVRP